MKTLLARSTKAMDQAAMSGPNQSTYLPLYNLQTWTGNGISPETALNVGPILQCVQVLADHFAQLPLIVYRRMPGGGKERAYDHPLYRVLHDRPNPHMSSFVWRKIVMAHLATWGNSYNEVTYGPTGRMQLWPVRPDRIKPSYDSSGHKVFDYLHPLGGRTRMAEGKIFHLQGLSSNGLLGESPILQMARTIGLFKAAESYGEALFRNGARPATVLSHPKTLSDTAVKRLAGQMDGLRGPNNAGKSVILEEGLTVTEVGFPPEAAQMMQTRVFQKREVAAAYRIPLHKIGDLERATFSNIEHQSLEFIQDTMQPWFVNAEQEMEYHLLDDPDYYIEFLVDGYLRGDAQTRASVNATRWQHGNLSADEWRAMENENPLPDGLGAQYYVPVNYAAVNPVGDNPQAPVIERQTITGPLTVVKSAEWRCQHLRPDGTKCNAKLGEVEGQGTVVTCHRCKAESVAESVMEQATKAVDPLTAALIRLATREPVAPPPPHPQPPAEVHFHEGAFKGGDITVEAPQVEVTMPEPRPMTRRVERNASNKIVSITEVPA